MVAFLSAVVSIFAFRFRSRAALELKLVALQHQLAILHRQRPGRPQLSSPDRLLWVLLYRIWPQVIDAMVLVKPATVVDWRRLSKDTHPWLGGPHCLTMYLATLDCASKLEQFTVNARSTAKRICDAHLPD
jgi:hypothetical protein